MSEEVKAKGVAVSECMLSNSVCTIAGVGIGMFFGIRRKSLRPFVYAITLGSSGDLFYGYYGNCRESIADYNASKAIHAATQASSKTPPSDTGDATSV